jgi:hypothetical protein
MAGPHAHPSQMIAAPYNDLGGGGRGGGRSSEGGGGIGAGAGAGAAPAAELVASHLLSEWAAVAVPPGLAQLVPGLPASLLAGIRQVRGRLWVVGKVGGRAATGCSADSWCCTSQCEGDCSS